MAVRESLNLTMNIGFDELEYIRLMALVREMSDEMLNACVMICQEELQRRDDASWSFSS